MSRLTSSSNNRTEHLPPLHPPLPQSVDRRVSEVRELICERRRVALVYRRSQSDVDRSHLEHMDRALASYNIDIPGIQRCVALRKV